MPKPTPEEVMKLPYERVIIPEEDGGFSAYIPEFEGVLADGETADEALANLTSAAKAWIQAEQDAGRDIPEPWNLQEFSGKVLLRLPKSLHQRLARQADREGISLNQYVVHKLSAGAREAELIDVFRGLFTQESTQVFHIGQFGKFVRAGTSPKRIAMRPVGRQFRFRNTELA
jgi:antitoxin HicB